MNNILNWKETVPVDTSIEKINQYEYEPHQGTRLNDVGDIRITITNKINSFTLLKVCFISKAS